MADDLDTPVGRAFTAFVWFWRSAMDRTTKTTVDIKRLGDLFEITLAGDSDRGIRRVLHDLVNSLLDNKEQDLVGCQITTCPAAFSPQSNA